MFNSTVIILSLLLISFIFNIQSESLRLQKRETTSCCSEFLEKEFKVKSKTDFNLKINKALSETLDAISNRTHKFDEAIKDLLRKSKIDFHEMFRSTYGMLYEKYAHIFKEVFTNFENYYNKGNISLSEAFDKFFHVLYQKMFEILNSQYHFDEKYLDCASKHMDELKPFGDAPKKLIIEIERSFIATRAFVQAFFGGQDVIKNVLKIPQTNDCYSSIMDMNYCSFCKGISELKPCKNYCQIIIKKCLWNYSSLDKEWNNYIEALIQLIGRLETSFNIESVVGPINIKISEAIMNFQDNGDVVSKRLFGICGKPRIKTRALNTNKFVSNEYIEYKHDSSNDYSSHIEELLKDIKRKLKRIRDIWSQLPQIICNSFSVSSISPEKNNKNCWNGTGLGMINVKPYEESLKTFSNIASAKQMTLISQQTQTLKLYVNRLNLAYNGLEVNPHQDVESDFTESSGSGSGDGENEGDNENDEYYNALYPHSSSTTAEDIYFSSSTFIPNLVSETIDTFHSINDNNLDVTGLENKNSKQGDVQGSATMQKSFYEFSLLTLTFLLTAQRLL